MMDSLADFLQKTKAEQYDTGLEFEYEVLPGLCKSLEIDQKHLFFEFAISGNRRADGAVAAGPDKRPWLVLEAKYSDSSHILQQGMQEVAEYRNLSEATYGVLIGKGHLGVVGTSESKLIDVQSASDEDIEEVQDLLSPPKLPSVSYSFDSEGKEISKVKTERFELDLDHFERALAAVDAAESTQEKGATFEEFANLLLGGITFLRVRNRNLRTRTGEIDLVVEYTGADELTIFDEWSRFLLVECKNWSSSVGVSQIRNFKGKMDKAQVDIGVLFAREGISGDEGADALRCIHDYFQREGQLILIIGNDEIQQLRQGESLYQILDNAMYRRRFDF